MGKLTGDQVTALHNRNLENLKQLKSGEWIGFMQARQLVMIGNHHAKEAINLYQDSTVKTRGKIQLVKKAKGGKKSEVLILAQGSKDAAEFEEAFGRIMSATFKWQWAP
jgi:hypothetical protein